MRPAYKTLNGQPLLSNDQVEKLWEELHCLLPDAVERAAYRALFDEVCRARRQPAAGSWWGDGLPAEVLAKLERHYVGLPDDIEEAPPLDIAVALLNDARVLLTVEPSMAAPPAAVDRAWACICDALRRIEQEQLARRVRSITSEMSTGSQERARWLVDARP
jgi:hypothetical protein